MALSCVVKRRIGAVRRRQWIRSDIDATCGIADSATAKTITARRRERCTICDALLRQRQAAIGRIVAIGTKRTRCTVRRAKNTAHMNRAAIIAGTAVAVEETVLIDGVDVVSGDACAKRAFAIVERTGALNIRTVDATIAVIVDAVATLGGTRHATGWRIYSAAVSAAVHQWIAVAVNRCVDGATIFIAAPSGETNNERKQ